jgi:outer membrane protein OmpA-like peptidoglycan-associated protein
MKKMLLSLCLFAAAPLASAQDAPPAGSPFLPGWYVAPMATYMKPDSARCNVDSDFGAAAVFGHRGDFGSLELWGQFLSLPHGECSYTVPAPTATDPEARAQVTEPAGTVKLNGAGISLLVGPFTEDRVLSRFFGLIGFGAIRREGHPQYTQGDTTIVGDVGLGYMQPLQLFGVPAAVRFETRYRYDVQQPPHLTAEEQDPPPAQSYEDLIFNLGLQFALSAPPAAMPEAAAPVAVVATADADGDGVGDDSDQCPDTLAGTAVDGTGCAPPPPAEPAPPAEPTIETAKAGDKIVLHGVNFETARATLTTNARTILDQVAEKLVARPELRIEVGGHTDARGSDAYNQDLSDRRAQSVMAYLTERGVDAASLTAVGYGEAQPVDSNDTDEGRERNRRVELKVLDPAPAVDTGADTGADTDSTTTTPGESS